MRSGLLKLSVDLPSGAHRIVRILRPGDVAGIEALLGGQYRHHAIVLREADVCRIPVDVVRQLDQTNPTVHRALLERWQRAVDQADNFIAALSTGSAEVRLARLLLGMACEQDLNTAFVLTREDMGALLGVTTETASPPWPSSSAAAWCAKRRAAAWPAISRGWRRSPTADGIKNGVDTAPIDNCQ